MSVSVLLELIVVLRFSFFGTVFLLFVNCGVSSRTSSVFFRSFFFILFFCLGHMYMFLFWVIIMFSLFSPVYKLIYLWVIIVDHVFELYPYFLLLMIKPKLDQMKTLFCLNNLIVCCSYFLFMFQRSPRFNKTPSLFWFKTHRWSCF